MGDGIDVSAATITALARVITGGSHNRSTQESRYGPYRSGPDLIEFFEPFGADEVYGSGFPARNDYAKDHLRRLNGTAQMKGVIEAAVDPRHYLEVDDVEVEDGVEYLNEYLEHDGFRLVEVGKRYRLRSVTGVPVEATELSFGAPDERHQMIARQIEKCERRLESGDFTGAITAARSLVEGVLKKIEALLDPSPPDYAGKLSPLYSRVYPQLNLDPGQEGIHRTTREALSGLISVVSGLAPMRNKMGDAHPFEYRPRRHHAELAVNAAKTLVNFLDGTLTYQQEQGLIDLEAVPDDAR